ncbi:hypothetical protein JST56_03970 [Candidatus Dependentiae bacterium]|jgi:hypothetical protein|nr:hypothetical protein [Candidatus Dependentiae bacterium]
MNIAKQLVLFVASIFFCHTQVQAMDRIADNFHKSVASGDKNKMFAAFTDTVAFIYGMDPQNRQQTPDGWIYSSVPLSNQEQPLDSEQSLQPDEILELVPSSIEFPNETDKYVFNILATLKFFEYVIQHYEFVFLLPKKFHSFSKDKFEEHLHTLSLRYSTELKRIRIPQTKLSKIQAMVDRNLQKIIDARISNL